MSTPRIERMEPHGPDDTGLVDWGPIEPGEIENGTPVQRGHLYLNDEDAGLMIGVWDCTAYTSVMGPYPVNEFMFVLEGSVTMVLSDGCEETISAGQAFIIPKGLVCQWKQPGYIRKYFVIFDDSSGTAVQDPSSLGIIRPRADGSVTEIDNTNAGPLFISQVPKQGIHQYYIDPTGQLAAGLWESEPCERDDIPFDRHELMCILEGSVTLSDGSGEDKVIRAGEAAFVPLGTSRKWKSDEFVRKFFCIFTPA